MIGWYFIALTLCMSVCGGQQGDESLGFSEINEPFAKAFVEDLINSGLLGKKEDKDLSEIMHVLLSAIRSLSEVRNEDPIQQRTMMMTFASTLAMTMAQEADKHFNLNQQMRAVTHALRQAYLQQNEDPNEDMVREIQLLVGIFLDDARDSKHKKRKTILPFRKHKSGITSSSSKMPVDANNRSSKMPVDVKDANTSRSMPLEAKDAKGSSSKIPVHAKDANGSSSKMPVDAKDANGSSSKMPVEAKDANGSSSKMPVDAKDANGTSSKMIVDVKDANASISKNKKEKNIPQGVKSDSAITSSPTSSLDPNSPSLQPDVDIYPRYPLFPGSSPTPPNVGGKQGNVSTTEHEPSQENSLMIGEESPLGANGRSPYQDLGLQEVEKVFSIILRDNNKYVPKIISTLKAAKSTAPRTFNLKVLVRGLSSVFRSMKNDNELSHAEAFIELLMETMISAIEVLRVADDSCVQQPNTIAGSFKYINALNDILF